MPLDRRPPAGPEHVVLLGDSIFDNAAYTQGAPDVVTHLRGLLGTGATATLCAVDGATVDDLASQLRRVPRDATRLVIAVGGNDALQNLDLLDRPVSSTGEALAIFGRRVDAFAGRYAAAIDRALEAGPAVIVCTIYNGSLPGETGHLARIGLMLFNDAILRTAAERGLRAIELRAVCTEPADYANPIEPSGAGGLKIAKAIVSAISSSS